MRSYKFADLALGAARWPLVAAIAFASPAFGQGSTGAPAAACLPPGKFSLGPASISQIPGDAELDTTWIKLGPAFGVCRIRNRTNAWAAQCSWFELIGEPDHVYRIEELDSLEAHGRLTPSTRLAQASYRYAVRAASEAEARERAVRTRPAKPPKVIRQELRRRAD